jgi:flagella basal body P-ring formation protein FlgA
MRCLVTLLLAFMLFGLTIPAAFGLDVVFKPRAQIEDSAIRLRDVALLSPADAAKQYADLVLFNMRDNRSVQEYRSSTLQAYIQHKLGETKNVSFSGEDSVLVRRAGGNIISEQIMLEQVQQYLEKYFDHPAVSSIEFQPRKFPEPFVLQVPDWECTVRPSREILLSSRRFSLDFHRNNRLLHTAQVRGEVRVRARVVTASRDIPRGRTIEANDVELQDRELSGRFDPIFEIRKVVGKRMQSSLRSGAIIENQNIARPYLVRRRKPVTLILRKGKMLISAAGIAQEDGAKMDRICAQNTSSGQEVCGWVVAKDTIEVTF